MRSLSIKKRSTSKAALIKAVMAAASGSSAMRTGMCSARQNHECGKHARDCRGAPFGVERDYLTRTNDERPARLDHLSRREKALSPAGIEKVHLVLYRDHV